MPPLRSLPTSRVSPSIDDSSRHGHGLASFLLRAPRRRDEDQSATKSRSRSTAAQKCLVDVVMQDLPEFATNVPRQSFCERVAAVIGNSEIRCDERLHGLTR